MVEGYCVKCKSKHEMQNTEEVKLKNNRNAVKGTCNTCNTKMFKITGKKPKVSPAGGTLLDDKDKSKEVKE